MKKILTLFVLFFSGILLQAADTTNTFTFTADMSNLIGTGAYKFDPSTDSILVMGLDWAGGKNVVGTRKMTRVGTTNNYTTNLTVTRNGQDTTSWKFKAYPDSKFINSGWEADPNNWAHFGVPGGTIILPTLKPRITLNAPPAGKNIIKFTADLSQLIGAGSGGHFDVAKDSILVMGLDWDGAGTNVQGSRKMVADLVNPALYSTTLSVYKTKFDSTGWKFKTYPDSVFSNGGWELGNNRIFYYIADTNTTTVLPALIPNISPLFGNLTTDVEVDFRVDMHNAKNRYNQQPIPLSSLSFVGMRGGANFLGTWVSGGGWIVSDTLNGQYMKVLNDKGINGDLTANDGIWSYKAVVPAGTAGGNFEFKFAAYYPGADTVNGGSSPLDNENGFGQNHNFILKQVTPAQIILNLTFGKLTSIERYDNPIPENYSLQQNYPNPFNPSTTLRFSIPQKSMVSLKIYDITGREVQTLVNEELAAGTFNVSFDAGKLATGVYFYTLRSNDFVSTKKMMLIK